MTSATGVGSPLDRLPDEVLRRILYFAMESRDPFFLEYEAQASKYLERENYNVVEPLPPVYESWSVYYKHRDTTALLKRRQDPTQVEHMADWIIVNSTNRRIRRLGKEEFFKAKILAMTHALPGRLQTGAVRDLVSPEDRALALEYARDVVILDNNPYAPSEFVGLAKSLQPLSRLRACTLLFGYYLSEPPKRIARAVAGTPEAEGRFKMPNDLRQLFVDTGVPENINLQVAVCGRIPWHLHLDTLVQHVYPMLRFRAQALTRKRMAENKEPEFS
ncbi:hypothetical protein F4810DRAFT_586182 [Camillea tinctor]|nr:hypothetical protein F4810DRAFT_586182 [Camillea tinctor]